MTKATIISCSSCGWHQQLAVPMMILLVVILQCAYMTAAQKFFMDGSVGCTDNAYGISIDEIYMECEKEKYEPECDEDNEEDADCYDRYGNYKYDLYQDEQVYSEVDDEWKKDAPCYFDNFFRLYGQITNQNKLPTNVQIIPRLCHRNGYSCTEPLTNYMYVDLCDYLEGGECPYATTSYFDAEMFMPQTYLTNNLYEWAKERQEQLNYNMGYTEEVQEEEREYAEQQYQEEWGCDEDEWEENPDDCERRQEPHDCEEDEDPEETGCTQRSYGQGTVGTVSAKFMLRVEIRPIQDLSVWSRMWDAQVQGISWAEYQENEQYDGNQQQQVDQYNYYDEQEQYQYQQQQAYEEYQEQQAQGDDVEEEAEDEDECPEDDYDCIEEQQENAKQAYQRMIYNYMNEPTRSIYCHVPFRLVSNEYNVTSYKERNGYYKSWFYRFINNMLSDCQITWTCNAEEVDGDQTYYYAGSVGAVALLGGIFSIYKKKRRRLATAAGGADEAFVADGDSEGTIEFSSSSGAKSQRPAVIEGDSYVTMS